MGYETSGSDAAAMGIAAVVVLLVWLASIVVSLIILVATWRLFVKAGKPGWASIIPVYNIIVMLEITRRPIWWLIMFFVPFVGLVFSIMLNIDFVKAYGKDTAYGVLSIFFPFITYPILAFGKNTTYVAPVGEGRVDTLGTPPPTRAA